MGALTFEPEMDEPLAPGAVDLQALATESQTVLADKDTDALRQLALMGGSPHGARPKVLVYWDRQTGQMSTTPDEGSQAWLIKFQAQGEHKEVCAIEDLYATMARECGLDMPETHYFDLGPNLAAFGARRFDIEDRMRVPMMTLAGLLHANFRHPQVDYLTFLRATSFLTRDVRELEKAFERAVFNVVFHNRDDHAKNFSFRLNRQREWKLAPCYDLTFDEGPSGEHAMDIEGKGFDIRAADLLQLAQKAGIAAFDAEAVIARIIATAKGFEGFSGRFAIRNSSLLKIIASIIKNYKT